MSESIILEQKSATVIAGAPVSRRERLYIFPTRYGFIYAGMLAVMLLGAVNYTNNMAYMLTFMLGSLFLVCMLHTYRNLRGLVINVGDAMPVFAGETARFPVVLDNRGTGRRRNIAIEARAPRRDARRQGGVLTGLSVGADGMHRDALPVHASSRGYLRPGRLKISSTFPLGLFRAWSWLDGNCRGIVYPKPSGDPVLPAWQEDNTHDRSGALSGTDDFTGFRPYQPGDSIRNIDWKAWAREQGLLVKRFSGSGARKLILHWDHTARLADTESRLSQLALWVVLAEQAGLQYGLVLPGVRLDAGNGEMHRHQCLRELAVYGHDA